MAIHVTISCRYCIAFEVMLLFLVTFLLTNQFCCLRCLQTETFVAYVCQWQWFFLNFMLVVVFMWLSVIVQCTYSQWQNFKFPAENSMWGL